MTLQGTLEMMSFEKLQSRASGSDSWRATGNIVHLDRELLQMIDTSVELGYQHGKVSHSLHVWQLLGISTFRASHEDSEESADSGHS